MRSSPLKRTPIKRTGFLRRTGRLPAESAKRKVVRGQRKKMLAEFYSDTCIAAELLPDVRCGGPLDPHEPLTRARGGSITDPENLVWICRAHHDYCHDHPIEATELGLLKPSGPLPAPTYQRIPNGTR